MSTGVLLSVDTEFTWRTHLAGASGEENYLRSIEAAGVGIPYQLELLARHGLRACFFVDPMPALVFGIDPFRRVIDLVLEAGQEVQLHAHPAWMTADRRTPPSADLRFEFSAFPPTDQLALIEQARELLCQAGAPMPVAFRAGSFGADSATLAAVAKAGLRYDSSHNGAQMPWPCETGLPPRAVAPFAHGSLIELPMGLLDEGNGRLRHLQVGAISLSELRGALLHAEAEGNPLVTILCHSFEMATRSGLRVNRFVRRRFEGLCAWLEAHGDRFQTRRIDGLGDIPLGHPATPAPAHAIRRLARIAEQGVSNLVYEHGL